VIFEIESSSVFSTVDAADSIEQAIIQAASNLLPITRDDIDIVHLGFSSKHIEFAMVGAVPAGAGFAPTIGSRPQDVIEHALKIVERCNCGEETSCHQCLSTYSNQSIHEKTKAGLSHRMAKRPQVGTRASARLRILSGPAGSLEKWGKELYGAHARTAQQVLGNG
jgi:ATP-dependent helicase YprA (DUF1998 family)